MAGRRLEKYEQADGVRLLRVLGAVVYVSGTSRRRGDYQGTNQTPGIPDVEAFLPTRAGRRLLKWECKAPGGRLSPAQNAYRVYCAQADVAHVAGDLSALMAWLVENGYLDRSQLPHDRQPLQEHSTP